MEEACLDLGRVRIRLGDPQDAGDEEGPAVEKLDDLEPLISLADEMVGAVSPVM